MDYEDLLKEVLFYFSERIVAARQIGIIDLIVDPGFGFSKTIDQSFELLNSLKYLKFTEVPVLIGVSRKSMIFKSLNSTPNEALNGTSVLNTIALQKGASILSSEPMHRCWSPSVVHWVTPGPEHTGHSTWAKIRYNG